MSNVLIVGITGNTGRVIANELLAAGTFRVCAIVRPSSLDKPAIKELKAAGVEIHVGDVATDSVDRLKDSLKGVDIVISTVIVLFVDQRNLILAAKEAGVKRFVPSEFGPHLPRGIMRLIDEKLAIRDFIISLGDIGYTFIETGQWLAFLFPYPHSVRPSKFERPMGVYTFLGKGDKKVAGTELEHVGKFVRRIIEDPRTLNKTVLAWEHELTLQEAWKIGQRISGEDFSDYPKLSEEEILQLSKESEPAMKTIYEYLHAMFLRGDNTVSNAVAVGVLDAQALYPDLGTLNLEEYVKEFYRNPPRLHLGE